MSNKNVLREDIKKHTTKNVILKIDYVPIPDSLIEDINSALAQKFLVPKRPVFDSFRETILNRFDLQANDVTISAVQELANTFKSQNELLKTKTFEYSCINNGAPTPYAVFSFNRYFLSVKINQSSKYCGFEYYSKIIDQMLDVIRKKMGDSLILTRIGLRKINDFFVCPDTDIKTFVQDSFFQPNYNILLSDVKGVETVLSEQRHYYKMGNISTCLLTHHSTGMLGKRQVKRLAFDTDAYMLKDDISQSSGNIIKKLEQLNNHIFMTFTSLLQPDFLEFLKDTKTQTFDKLIMGVNNNE